MSDKKQTAVEWLINEIKFARNLCDDPSAEMDIWHTLDVLIAKGEQAKEMEKLKAFEIFKAGQDSMEEGGKGFEQFYEQTYGGNK
jgi:predicted secreted protein